MNRIVECGSCEARFRINDEVIVRSKKFYPGEKKKAPLARLSRLPSVSGVPNLKIQTAEYEDSYHPELAEPASAQRLIAGAFAVILFVITALIFVFSSSTGNSLGMLPIASKLTIASFIALVVFILLIYANPRARWSAGLFGLLLGFGLVAIPYFMVPEIPKVTDVPESKDDTTSGMDTQPAVQSIEALRERFGTELLEKEQQRYASDGSSEKAYGIYITKIQGRYRYTARDYLIRESEADESSYQLPRESDNLFLLLTGVEKDISEVASIAGRLGKTTEIHPEIGVIVISVNNDLFVTGPQEKLNDKFNPAFYDLNLLELQSFDIERVHKAVERLADAEPKFYRADITKLLTQFIQKPGVSFHDDLCRALQNWAEDIQGPSAAALVTLKAQYTSQNLVPPESLVSLVCKGKDPDAIPVIKSLWINNPFAYEKYFSSLGSQIETTVLQETQSNDATVRHSAIKILALVGTSASLPTLQNLLKHDDPETPIHAERAINQIESR